MYFSTAVENDDDAIKRVAERPPRDRRRIAEGSLTLGLKISNLPSCMTRVRNALVFRRYVIVTKKAQRTHEEGRKNA